MLELQNISFGVTEDNGTGSVDKEILNDINLTIEDNKFVVITGPNGGGKSTLAKIIAGIEKPTSGRILLDGQDITDKKLSKQSQEVRFLFLNFKILEIGREMRRLIFQTGMGLFLWAANSTLI